jgi:hypothetical protein
MKRAWWLFALGAIATLLSFPFPPPPLLLAGALLVVESMVWAGLWFGAPNGLGSSVPSPLRAFYALLIGVISGAVVVALLPLAGLQSRIIKEASIPLWKWLIIAFDSSILEEIIFRLFIVSFAVWLLARFVRREIALRIAVIASALLFGAAHLGRWLDAGPIVITAVMIVNGVVGVVFGRLYVTWGIEAAIISHFGADVMLHIVGPHFFI